MAVMPRGWEGNRRSGVALAMRHGLKCLSTYGLNGLRKGDEHPAYAPASAWLPLPLPLCGHWLIIVVCLLMDLQVGIQ